MNRIEKRSLWGQSGVDTSGFPQSKDILIADLGGQSVVRNFARNLVECAKSIAAHCSERNLVSPETICMVLVMLSAAARRTAEAQWG